MYIWYLVYKNGYSEIVNADDLSDFYNRVDDTDLVVAIKLDPDKIKRVMAE